MAEFCKQCAEDMGFTSDFIDPTLSKGLYRANLCEGCGPIQTNNKGECVSSDCLEAGHHVPLDADVVFYTLNEGFQLGSVPHKEIEHGEWAAVLPGDMLEINDIEEIPLIKGYRIYMVHLSAYTLIELT